MLNVNPEKRFDINDILQHDFMKINGANIIL